MSRKWVLVTGGSRGIGRALVETLARDWNVIFTCRCPGEESQETVDACASLPGRVEARACDGSDERQIDALAPLLIEKYGAPHAVIHNAGIALDGLHIQQPTADWQQTLNSHLSAVFYWNRRLLPAMILNGDGALVLMSSVTAIKGNPGQTAYAASKAAMIGLCRSLAPELGRFGLRVNCLAPGLIESDMTEAMPAARLEAMRRQIPLRRLGTPEEVARVTAFLIGDDSRYMTGQTLVLDGGLTA